MALQYQLTKKFAQGTEKVIATFADEKHAREFMDAQVAWDHKTKVETIYRLYSHTELLAEVNAKEYESVQAAESTEKHSSITPFGTTPKPPGTAPSTKKYEDFDDDEQ